MSTILFELGCEELPPKSLKLLRDALQESFIIQSAVANITFDSIKAFAAPRRLALQIKGISPRQPDRTEEKRGPAIKAAFDADQRHFIISRVPRYGHNRRVHAGAVAAAGKNCNVRHTVPPLSKRFRLLTDKDRTEAEKSIPQHLTVYHETRGMTITIMSLRRISGARESGLTFSTGFSSV